jgi:hypothetical protein
MVPKGTIFNHNNIPGRDPCDGYHPELGDTERGFIYDLYQNATGVDGGTMGAQIGSQIMVLFGPPNDYDPGSEWG